MKKLKERLENLAEYVSKSDSYIKERIVEDICKIYEEKLVKWALGSAKFPSKLTKAGIHSTKEAKKIVKDDIKSIRKKIEEAVTKEVESGKWDVSIVAVNRNISHLRAKLIESLVNLYANRPYTVFQDGINIDFLSDLMSKIIKVAPESKSIFVIKEAMRFYLVENCFVLEISDIINSRMRESKVFRDTVVEVATKHLQETPKIAESLGMVYVLAFLVRLSKDDYSVISRIFPVWIDAIVKTRDTQVYDLMLESFTNLNSSIMNEVCDLFIECLVHSLFASEEVHKDFLKHVVGTANKLIDFMIKRNVDRKVAMKFYESFVSLSALLSSS